MRLGACVTGALALCLIAGGTPERDIYVTVKLKGDPPPPDTVLVQTASLIPASVAPGQRDVAAYFLSISRRSQACDVPIYLAALGFRIEHTEGTAIDPTDYVERMSVVPARALARASAPQAGAEEAGGAIAGHSTPPEGPEAQGAPRGPSASLGQSRSSESVLELELATPALIPVLGTLDLEIHLDVSPSARPPGFSMTLDVERIFTSQGSCLSPVLIVRHGSQEGPAVATTAVISERLAGSFLNYPNPFAAGRQLTTFTFFLQRPAEIALRLYTGFGTHIVTLADGSLREGGVVHEDITWDGKDDTGATLQNGTYFAVLSVRYRDGTTEEAVRKVAVVR